ncbi:hypothetical protein BH23ACT4_BH23ACT4_10090 [soil metagenome]
MRTELDTEECGARPRTVLCLEWFGHRTEPDTEGFPEGGVTEKINRQFEARVQRYPMPTPASGTARTSRAVILAEGPSDQVAIEMLAARRGYDLERSGVTVVAIGGATNLRPFLETYGPKGRGALLAGLGDIGEVAVYGRTLSRAGVSCGPSRQELEEVGFHMCVVDLEDELIRALGSAQTRSIVELPDTPGSFRSYQRQPAHRAEPLDTQLRGFVTNWKIEYARLFVGELNLAQVPRPLQAVLDYVLR